MDASMHNPSQPPHRIPDHAIKSNAEKVTVYLSKEDLRKLEHLIKVFSKRAGIRVSKTQVFRRLLEEKYEAVEALTEHGQGQGAQ